MRTKNFLLMGAAFLVAAIGACAETDQTDIPADALVSGESFVPIARPASDSAAVRMGSLGVNAQAVIAPGKGDDFYLAINKKELGQKWFLSGYMRQWYPGGAVNMGAARSLGTRVVSFKIQNGKLFMFDVADNKQESDLFDPEILVEAWPVVKGYAPFDALTNADQYVLFDPADGQNKLSAGADNFYDFYLSNSGSGAEFKVGLAFTKAFRKLSDGVTYQQVFTGTSVYDDGTGHPFEFRASGTMGIALRKYNEGEGFKPTAMPYQPFYFSSDWKSVPNTGGYDYSAMHWNIKPGMKPITFLITRDVLKFQADFPGVDVVGAVTKGVENWNAVFGFKALEAKIADEKDDIGEDDKNYIITDYDPSMGYAFANWRTNPNTGEVRGATVYFGGAWFQSNPFEEKEEDPNADELKKDRPAAPPQGMPTITWAPLKVEPLCAMPSKELRMRPEYAAAAAATSLTPNQKFELFLTHVVIHEMGHVLGLRHNFAASLANNSVMDYLNNEDSIARATPGDYDVAAIKYLYQLAPKKPTTAFGTDGCYFEDPECQMFDHGADPLNEDWVPSYVEFRDFVFEIGWGFGLLDYIVEYYMDGVLMWARAASEEDVALKAYETAIGPARAPIKPENLALDGYGAAADGLAMRVLRKLYLDPPELRGLIGNDPYHEAVIAASMKDLKDNLTNVDKIRSFGNRRTCVDILKKMQNADAYNILREGKAAILAAKSLGGMSLQEAADTDDLLARIERAITPYYEN